MTNSDHVSRTLLLSNKVPGTLIISRGSTSNIDPEAADITSGHSQIKAYNLLNRTRTYDFVNDGLLLGWGLRNDVGIDEEPITGGVYAVENSADDITRDNIDVHVNNPAEKLNYLGTLIGNTSPNQVCVVALYAFSHSTLTERTLGPKFRISHLFLCLERYRAPGQQQHHYRYAVRHWYAKRNSKRRHLPKRLSGSSTGLSGSHGPAGYQVQSHGDRSMDDVSRQLVRRVVLINGSPTNTDVGIVNLQSDTKSRL